MQELITKNNIDDYMGCRRVSSSYGGLYEDELIQLLSELMNDYTIVQVIPTEKNDDRSVNYIIIIRKKLDI